MFVCVYGCSSSRDISVPKSFNYVSVSLRTLPCYCDWRQMNFLLRSQLRSQVDKNDVKGFLIYLLPNSSHLYVVSSPSTCNVPRSTKGQSHVLSFWVFGRLRPIQHLVLFTLPYKGCTSTTVQSDTRSRWVSSLKISLGSTRIYFHGSTNLKPKLRIFVIQLMFLCRFRMSDSGNKFLLKNLLHRGLSCFA